MSGEEQKYIQDAFHSNWIAPLGPNVDAFEKELANKVRVNEAVALSSGTAAIHLALSLLGVEKGDTVFCSTLTFVASANPILYQGAEPVFIDSEPETWNMSPQALERALLDASINGKLPKAIIVVNLYVKVPKWMKLLLYALSIMYPSLRMRQNHLALLIKESQADHLVTLGSTHLMEIKLLQLPEAGCLFLIIKKR